MKLATMKSGTLDGRLAIVARDLTRAIWAPVPTLQAALDRWDAELPGLQALSDALNRGEAADSFTFDPRQAMAPLPRAYQWLDGSAFLAHGDLMTKALNAPRNPQGATPLVYQGASDDMLGPHDDAKFPSEALGIDFEGEFGAILGPVPMAPDPAEARAAVRLLVLLNDWSLRMLAPAEMSVGFGWMHCKPATSFSAVAVTPDELGDAWQDGRILLPLRVAYNAKPFGHPFGGAMHFNFYDIITHVARSRRLGAGTIIGSGTVSEGDPARVGCACLAELRGSEIIRDGHASTPFMRFGDWVRIELLDAAGASVFGAIDNHAVAAERLEPPLVVAS